VAHVRQQIREAVATKLTGLTTTGSRVLVGRTRPLGAGYSPTLLVYTTPAASGGQESVQRASLDGLLERRMMLSVVGHVQEPSPCDDTLDDIAVEVETALAQALEDGDFLGLVKDLVLQSTINQVDAEGDRHVGAIRLVFSVLYYTLENSPQTAA